MLQSDSLNAQTLAYKTIREQILAGELVGGEKLTEERLAEQIGVSRTPIREAIRRLEQEGLIQNKRVLKPTKADLIHLYEMQTLIECYAVRYASHNILDEQIALLKNRLATARKGTLEEMVNVSMDFHETIVAASKNPLMIAEIDKIRSIIYMFSSAMKVGKRPLLIDELEQIIKAIAVGNVELASKLLRKHLEANLNFTLNLKSDY
ncbi:GntR family transcriptional regulator [Solibacillus sp. FSL H8-0538]|uniref:GntR family transcriptional regulator n=1 Tax=Solibacillus sp. FSL H8-0538 TaxID=2921400 RepID=UPI0030FB5624